MNPPPKPYYISTPIYYINDRPHLGTAYTNIIADIFNRYQKLFKRDSFFITGTDEHGQKCEQTAKSLNISPQEHCDRMSDLFKQTWKGLNIEYDLFFRTTHKQHKTAVQKVLQTLYDQGDIYSAQYKGWYCVSEEVFYKEKDLVEGKSPSGKPVIALEEKAWFFKMSKYKKSLVQYLDQQPDFIKPSVRYNEIQSFLKQDLQDLCISRPKKRLSWGIELPFDRDSITYVWVDALLNYITGLGHPYQEELFKKYWLNAQKTHLIGKDILMTHAVYWPCLLLALKLPLPNQLIAHGWLLNKNREKMSKSEGDKLDPIELSQKIGLDELRWFLAKEIPLGKDSDISIDFMIQKINEDLADTVGNIFSRVSRLIEKNFEGQIPVYKDFSKNPLKDRVTKTVLLFKQQITNWELSQALSSALFLLTKVNQYLEQSAPWKLLKSEGDQAKTGAGFILYNSLETLRICAILFQPVMPNKMNQLLELLGEKPLFENTRWGRLPLQKTIKKTSALFPKLKNL